MVASKLNFAQGTVSFDLTECPVAVRVAREQSNASDLNPACQYFRATYFNLSNSLIETTDQL